MMPEPSRLAKINATCRAPVTLRAFLIPGLLYFLADILSLGMLAVGQIGESVGG